MGILNFQLVSNFAGSHDKVELWVAGDWLSIYLQDQITFVHTSFIKA
jgi:hypothetical protein